MHTYPETPKLAFPFRMVTEPGSGGTFAVANEQDSTDEIIDCIHGILVTPEDHFNHDPEFGAFNQLGQFDLVTDSNAEVINEKIATSEPRAIVTIEEYGDSVDEAMKRVRVNLADN